MKQNKVISLVLNNFTNDSRVLKEAQSIQSFGYDIKVLALHENGLKEHETVDEVSVHRIKLSSKNWSKNRFVQMFKYFELAAKVIKGYRKANIVHCHDLSALPIACLMKWLSLGKLKLIYDSHEYAVNDLPFESKSRQKIKKIIEGVLIKSADAVITVSDGIANLYQQQYNLSTKPFVVLNCPKRQEVRPSNKLKSALGIDDDCFVFLYQGVLSRGRGIQQLIDAFKADKKTNRALVLMGYGELTDSIKAQQDDRIFYHPAVPPSEILDYTSSADCGVALIEDSCLSYRYCLPNKMFEYFMAGLPVIVSNLPEMKAIVEKFNVGLVTPSNDVSDFLSTIENLQQISSSELSKQLELLNSEYNWISQANVLKDVYNGL
ncbi:glycosyltransferase family 4 protein [Pseudoalteromonas sp. JC3]|uniref:glycosyltransferase family 4 protein n=1 Tax=Pseudoalteromonas sp. JC3 TaxID=2810196 RepID=UPI0019D1ECD0|nr:glycosyltransferase family 4 protein [Pseudoalteromonas sp. JC3]MBR8842456.1 glycosyltransferase family 4 protein [Pseudoalteromonas sp. JC3]WJE09425.1 glycosyltransferase family 4 protein [Pseudoalteromonas sp. JC3]